MIPIAISVLALCVSLVTLWLSFFFRGVVRTTEPSMVVFAYDPSSNPSRSLPKVMIRCHLFSTGERGRVIETLFAKLRYGDSELLFPIWGLDADAKLVRGGGLFVGKTGVTAWHHLVASAEENAFQYEAGTYSLQVCARIHDRRSPSVVWSCELVLPDDIAPEKHDGSQQVWFDHDPVSGGFLARLETRTV